MDGSAHKLLESVTAKTLHSQNFSKASNQASSVLTDLLSRYLVLLSSTAAKYAQHAGRTGLTARDAVEALEELGLSVHELAEFASGEGEELKRYAVHTARRVEDLNELRAQLQHGARQDHDDAIPLEYGIYEPLESEEDEDEEPEEPVLELPEPDLETVNAKLRAHPVLPLSPVSNPQSPSRKRARTADWRPPSHIPAFLPPFPSEIEPLSPDASRAPSPVPLSLDVDKLPSPPPQTIESVGPLLATSSSDYLARVPYAQSSLSAVPTWHLPGAPPRIKQAVPTRMPKPPKEASILAAMHHVISNPPPPNALQLSAHPFRHCVAMALLSQTQTNPRWEPPDTLFSSIAPCAPRESGVTPTHAVKMGPSSAKAIDFPPAAPRPISSLERMTSLVSQQPSRIPDLARDVLPWPVYTRSTTLRHPPVLQRGDKDLVYGPSTIAPWNNNPNGVLGLGPPPPLAKSAMSRLKREASPPPSGRRSSTGRPIRETRPSRRDSTYKIDADDDYDQDSDFEDSDGETKKGSKGKSKEGGNKKEDRTKAATVPDAKLFATWDYEVKDFRKPLVIPRNRVGSVPSGITLSLGGKKARARSEIT